MSEIIQAIIKDNEIIQTIVADDSFTYPMDHDLMINITEVDPKPGIGWTYIEEVFAPPEVVEDTSTILYVHLGLVGDGRIPVGIKNDGVDTLSVTATFRQTEDPLSTVITAVTAMSWRITIRDVTNNIYDIIDVTFTDGIASFDYTTDNKANICQILESDFEEITVGETTYAIRLFGDNTFKVYRAL
jgi:hypothetical protein